MCMWEGCLGEVAIIDHFSCVFIPQEQLDNWDFDIFRAEVLSNKQPLRFVGQELFSRHDLFRRCNVSHLHGVCEVSRHHTGMYSPSIVVTVAGKIVMIKGVPPFGGDQCSWNPGTMKCPYLGEISSFALHI